MTKENRKYVHYLWHLAEVGLFDKAALLKNGAKSLALPKVWENLKETRVAIIDSGCSRTHPNLDASGSDKPIIGQLDLAAHGTGAIYTADFGRSIQTEIDAHVAARKTVPAALTKMLHDVPQAALDLLMARANDFAGSKPYQVAAVPNPGETSALHGTACAGLVAGRTSDAAQSSDMGPAALAYFGVNPSAKIIPIATPYSHEIGPVITAIMQAIAFGAHVILMPRGVTPILRVSRHDRGELLALAEHEFRARAQVLLAEPTPKTNLRYSRNTTDWTLLRDQLLFEELVASVSRHIPFVMASGNGGFGAVEYPAALQHEGADQLFVVGAANSLGHRASYSSGHPSSITAFAPSDDEQSLGRDVLRYDEEAEEGFVHGHLASSPELQSKGNAYSPFAVVGIVPPLALIGSVDHEPKNPRHQPLNELYSRFGGTSAACSILAGLLSLKLAKEPSASVADLRALMARNAGHDPFGEVEITTLKSLKMA